MPEPPDPAAATRRDLAKALRDLRGATGLSGVEAGRRALMSQSQISRVETGRALPSLSDVERLLKAYGADEEMAARVLVLARSAAQEYRSGRASRQRGMDRKQAELAGLERSAAVMRHFLPAVPTGLLHTRAYAEATLAALGTVPSGVFGQVIDAKMARQDALRDPERRFVFLMTETAIRARVAPLSVMAGQCGHMADLAEAGAPSVEVGLVPFAARWPLMALNVFVLYDDRFVTVEVLSGEVLLHDPQDVAYHRGVFDRFWDVALVGAQAAAFLRAAAAEYQAMDRSV